MELRKMTYVAAMRDYFFRQGIDSLQTFMAELKQLTPEDKLELRSMLPTVGYEITDQPTPAVVN
jgi:hypothetical protein